MQGISRKPVVLPAMAARDQQSSVIITMSTLAQVEQ